MRMTASNTGRAQNVRVFAADAAEDALKVS
jgi:hypothetical protein